MSFCKLSNDYIKDGHTPIDNIFLMKYMPTADDTFTKVYLYGLTLAFLGGENSMEKISLALKMPSEKILAAFKYWEEKGLVTITTSFPTGIMYHSAKNALPPIVKYNVKDYKTFVEEVSRLFPEKILSPNEITEYIELIRINKMEINAMLLIIKYCIDYKMGKVTSPYILAVASDWIKKGLTTEDAVNSHINSLEANSEAIRMIFHAIGLKREADIDDRQFFLKWTLEYGYNLDALLVAAKPQKRRGGMERLNRYVEELRNADAFTALEVAEFTKNKEKIYDLAINVVKNIGGYYASMDIVIDTYIVPWLAKGFTNEALLMIAKFCFLKNVRNLDGMNQMITRFFKLGLLDETSIDSYIEMQISIDKKIMAVFEKCNHMGLVSNRDREFYRTWMEWGFDDDMILFVAKLADKNPFPMQSINRNLALLHQKSVNTINDATNVLKEDNKYDTKESKPSNYSDEQLKNVLVDFETWEL